MLVRCSDCLLDYRAKKDSDYANGKVCRRCQLERREAERDRAAAERMTIAVWGTNDPDELLKQDKAKEEQAA